MENSIGLKRVNPMENIMQLDTPVCEIYTVYWVRIYPSVYMLVSQAHSFLINYTNNVWGFNAGSLLCGVFPCVFSSLY